jgi:hypothetical protein
MGQQTFKFASAPINFGKVHQLFDLGFIYREFPPCTPVSCKDRKMRERKQKKTQEISIIQNHHHTKREGEKRHSEVAVHQNQKWIQINQVFLCLDPVRRFHHPRNLLIDVSSSCRGGTTTRPGVLRRAPPAANATGCPWCESDCEPLPLDSAPASSYWPSPTPCICN